MRILFTGASSFTGTWMAGELGGAGHRVTAVFTRPSREEYEGLRRRRIDRVLPAVSPKWQMRFGSEAFLELCRDGGPWDVLCHHAAEVTDYKSPDFNWERAFAANTYRLRETLAAFRQGCGKTVILTGTYFEADEGEGTKPRAAFSPYGLSKTLTWQAFRWECARAGLTLGKYVLPSPVGPLEEPRFVAYLTNCWTHGKPACIQTPNYLRDQLPVTVLAADYARFVEHAHQTSAGSLLRRNPSGWVETVGAFASRVGKKFQELSGLPSPIECHDKQPPGEPLQRRNTDSCLGAWSTDEENDFWSAWLNSYLPQPAAPAHRDER